MSEEEKSDVIIYSIISRINEPTLSHEIKKLQNCVVMGCKVTLIVLVMQSEFPCSVQRLIQRF